MQDIAVNEVADRCVKVPAESTRVVSLDIVRGVAMILMAIDHVRVYLARSALNKSKAIRNLAQQLIEKGANAYKYK